MSFIKGIPNPEGSPNEKFVFPPKVIPSPEVLFQELLTEGLPRDLARPLANAFTRYAHNHLATDDRIKQEIEYWTNRHTHPGGLMPGGAKPWDPEKGYVFYTSGTSRSGAVDGYSNSLWTQDSCPVNCANYLFSAKDNGADVVYAVGEDVSATGRLSVVKFTSPKTGPDFEVLVRTDPIPGFAFGGFAGTAPIFDRKRNQIHFISMNTSDSEATFGRWWRFDLNSGELVQFPNIPFRFGPARDTVWLDDDTVYHLAGSTASTTPTRVMKLNLVTGDVIPLHSHPNNERDLTSLSWLGDKSSYAVLTFGNNAQRLFGPANESMDPMPQFLIMTELGTNGPAHAIPQEHLGTLDRNVWIQAWNPQGLIERNNNLESQWTQTMVASHRPPNNVRRLELSPAADKVFVPGDGVITMWDFRNGARPTAPQVVLTVPAVATMAAILED